jgi:hypothetical protein
LDLSADYTLDFEQETLPRFWDFADLISPVGLIGSRLI